ncbi:cystathionine gamma-synthase [Fusarium mundagurra]|uniref:Cystathionine gamma-synthase n=1 Tax=Fusarium mundagurra TaxID=1567541 RepID=A0A8H5Y5J7_9HYPO|nr:cystathionine gamma-synthase [Fusarium mundagurra]
MSPSPTYSLADILAVARVHPFYCSTQYPPDEPAIQRAREEAASKYEPPDLKSWPLLRKNDLFTVIERLINDTDARNTYRHNVYTSVTGGGGGASKPLFFATDAMENRRHRALFGEFLKKTGIIERGDWVLSTHHGGSLYRSLDLTMEIMENAGGSVLAAGHQCPTASVVQILQDFNVTVLTGDSSQIISIVHQISTMPDIKNRIKIRKVVYTSEGLSMMQRVQICKVLGTVAIYSILGSAEAGPYGASSPFLVDFDLYSNSNDFIIDTRMTIIEVLPLSCAGCESDEIPEPLPDGETGIIAQTVLTRLRHPVIRYITGDIGSLHSIPQKAVDRIARHDLPHYRLLRLQGRDRRFSFMWDGCDFQFDKLNTILSDPQLGVLLWQVILDKMQPSQEISLEIRLLSGQNSGDTMHLQTLLRRLKACLDVNSSNEHKFKITFCLIAMAPTDRNWVYPNSLRALPLHEAHIYPPGTPHAVSSSLPTWQSVIDLATAGRTDLDAIDYSYPRFFFCQPIRSLVERVRQRLRFSSDDLDCYIFPSSEDASDYAAQLRANGVEAHHIRFCSPVPGPVTSTLYLAFSALLVPLGSRAHVRGIWVNLGTGITTRHAEYCLDHFDELVSISSLPRYYTLAERVPSHDPYSEEWIQRGASDLADLKAFIARLATSEAPDMKPVKAEDVFIFPNGMNAIYNASEAIAINNPNKSVVTFGWIYPETINNLRRGQWEHVIPFKLGREEDLDQLTHMLNPNDRHIYAIFCELPSNIKLTSPNLERIRSLAKDHGLVVVCDETVGNFVNIDLLPYVDIITTSLTKMFSGAANVTGGSVIVNPNSPHYEDLYDAINSRYETVSCFPKDISVLRENSINMVERVQKADANALRVMSVFTNHPAVAHVNHPSRDPASSANYERHRRQNGGYGNVFSVVFRNRGSAEHFYDNLDICKGSSFGTNFTLAIPFVQLAVYNKQESNENYGLPKHIIRISVGLERPRDIRAKMKQAMDEVEKFELGPGSEF